MAAGSHLEIRNFGWSLGLIFFYGLKEHLCQGQHLKSIIKSNSVNLLTISLANL